MGDLNAKVGLDNSAVEYVAGKHGEDIRNNDLTARRSTYWDGHKTSSPGQSLAKPGFQSSRKNESENQSTELGLKSVTATTAVVLWISAAPTIWLLAQQHSCAVRVIVSCQHPSGRHANQIDHLAISRRLRGCLEDIRDRKVADIGNLRDHY